MNQSLPDMTSLREEIVNTAQKAYREGMMAATSGNLSCYDAASGCIAITPSGMDYTIMKPEDIVIIDLDGNVLSGHKPSSEWKMHAEIYRHLPQYSAAVGTHCLPILSRKPAALLANHGVVTAADSLAQAYTNAVYVEDSAKIVRLAMSTGCPIPAVIDEEGSKSI